MVVFGVMIRFNSEMFSLVAPNGDRSGLVAYAVDINNTAPLTLANRSDFL